MSQRRRSGTAGRARSRSARHRCWRCASATSASSAGSCTSRPSTPPTCTTCCGEPASRTASSTSATGRSTGCGWRRATSTGRPTSRPTPRRWRPGSTGGSIWDKGDFCGRDALVAQRDDGVDAPAVHVHAGAVGMALPGRAARRSSLDDDVVGFTTTANFGHTVGKPIAYGYVAGRAGDAPRLRDRGLRRADPGHPPRRRAVRPERREAAGDEPCTSDSLAAVPSSGCRGCARPARRSGWRD